MEMTVDKETPLMGLNVILFLHLFIHPVVLIRVVAGLEVRGGVQPGRVSNLIQDKHRDTDDHSHLRAI